MPPARSLVPRPDLPLVAEQQLARLAEEQLKSSVWYMRLRRADSKSFFDKMKAVQKGIRNDWAHVGMPSVLGKETHADRRGQVARIESMFSKHYLAIVEVAVSPPTHPASSPACPRSCRVRACKHAPARPRARTCALACSPSPGHRLPGVSAWWRRDA